MYKPKFALFIDCETTGAEYGVPVEILAERFQAISLGAIVVDLDTFDEVESDYFEIKFDPQYEWTEDAERIHGISIEHLDQHGLEREEATVRLLELIIKYWGTTSPVILGGHNIAFDKAFIVQQFFEDFDVRVKIHHTLLDSAAIGLVTIGQNKSDIVFQELGGYDGQRAGHNALEDARLSLNSLKLIHYLYSEAICG